MPWVGKEVPDQPMHMGLNCLLTELGSIVQWIRAGLHSAVGSPSDCRSGVPKFESQHGHIGFNISYKETICMKCLILLPGKN